MIGSIVSICRSQHKGANYISPHWTTLVYLWLQAAEAVASKMHFSYAGITCYYAILVWESLAANSDRAKPRASSRSRQPFKGQLNASLAQGGSTKALKNNFFLPWRNLPSDSASAFADPFYAIRKDFLFRLLLTFFNFFSTTRSAFSAWHFRWCEKWWLKKKSVPDYLIFSE